MAALSSLKSHTRHVPCMAIQGVSALHCCCALYFEYALLCQALAIAMRRRLFAMSLCSAILTIVGGKGTKTRRFEDWDDGAGPAVLRVRATMEVSLWA